MQSLPRHTSHSEVKRFWTLLNLPATRFTSMWGFSLVSMYGASRIKYQDAEFHTYFKWPAYSMCWKGSLMPDRGLNITVHG